MPDWLNMQGAGRVSAVGESFTIGNVGGVLVTNGAANTKGSWAVVSASTPWDAHGICVSATAKSTTGDQLVDIGIGAAASEQVIVPNLLWTSGSPSNKCKMFWIPIYIPAGSRLVARSQSVAGSATGRISVSLMQEGWLGHSCVSDIDALGVNTGSTTGTALGNPAANNTWGAWTQIAATAGLNYKWIMPVFGDQGITTRTASSWYAGQIGIGGAGNEQGLGPEYVWGSFNTAFAISSWSGFWTDIPSSERLVMRQGSTTSLTPGCDGVLYCGR